MIEKSAIEVYAPTLGKTFQFVVPEVMDAGGARELVLNMIAENYPETATMAARAVFLNGHTESQIPETGTCEEAGLVDGVRLMLIWMKQ